MARTQLRSRVFSLAAATMLLLGPAVTLFDAAAAAHALQIPAGNVIVIYAVACATPCPHDEVSERDIVIIALPLLSCDETVQQQRMEMVVRLLELGHDPAEAAAMTMQLTPDDLDVLLANPRMLQPAAGLSQTSVALIVGALIVAGIVLLAVSSKSSGSVSIGGG